MRKESICIFGDGTQERAFSDVRFILEPFEKLMTEFDGEVFNLGCTNQYSLNEIADIVARVGKEFGYDAKIEHLEQRLGEAKYAYCDHSKAESLLGFKDETNLEETIREMFDWAKTQPERKVKMMDYELDKGMYSYWK